MTILHVYGEEFLVSKYVESEINAYLCDRVFTFSDDVLPERIDEILSLNNDSSERYVYHFRRFTKYLDFGFVDKDLVLFSSPNKLEVPNNVYLKECAPLKTHYSMNDIQSFILNRGANFNIDLSKISSALFVNSGNRPRKLDSEIRKISDLVSSGSALSADVAKSIMVFSSELTPKSIIDAINLGNKNAAIAYYDKLQESKNETGWIVAFLQNHFEQLYKFEYYLTQNRSADEIASLIGVPSFVLKNFLSPLKGLWTIESMKKSLRCLTDIEIAHKTGSELAEFLLESEIIRYSEEAADVISKR
jgi:hypothetical protein